MSGLSFADEGHHAPEPVHIDSRLARGLIEIVDTPEGERMRLRVSRHAQGLAAVVEITRQAGAETLPLESVFGDVSIFLPLAPAQLAHNVT